MREHWYNMSTQSGRAEKGMTWQGPASAAAAAHLADEHDELHGFLRSEPATRVQQRRRRQRQRRLRRLNRGALALVVAAQVNKQFIIFELQALEKGRSTCVTLGQPGVNLQRPTLLLPPPPAGAPAPAPTGLAPDPNPSTVPDPDAPRAGGLGLSTARSARKGASASKGPLPSSE